MDGHRLAEARSIALHRAVAEKLRADPRLLARARARVAEWRISGAVMMPYVEGWERMLALDLDALCSMLADPGENARALRQVSPFAGAVPPRERWRIWRTVRETVAIGYYAQGVDKTTAILPGGWQERLVPIKNPNTRGATGWCLEVHDLVIAKAVAGRDKDRRFIAAAFVHGMVSLERLRERLAATSLEPERRRDVEVRLQVAARR